MKIQNEQDQIVRSLMKECICIYSKRKVHQKYITKSKKGRSLKEYITSSILLQNDKKVRGDEVNIMAELRCRDKESRETRKAKHWR